MIQKDVDLLSGRRIYLKTCNWDVAGFLASHFSCKWEKLSLPLIYRTSAQEWNGLTILNDVSATRYWFLKLMSIPMNRVWATSNKLTGSCTRCIRTCVFARVSIWHTSFVKCPQLCRLYLYRTNWSDFSYYLDGLEEVRAHIRMFVNIWEISYFQFSFIVMTSIANVMMMPYYMPRDDNLLLAIQFAKILIFCLQINISEIQNWFFLYVIFPMPVIRSLTQGCTASILWGKGASYMFKIVRFSGQMEE